MSVVRAPPIGVVWIASVINKPLTMAGQASNRGNDVLSGLNDAQQPNRVARARASWNASWTWRQLGDQLESYVVAWRVPDEADQLDSYYVCQMNLWTAMSAR